MTEHLESIASQVLEALDARRVLDIINYRLDTILEQETSVKAFCPIHQELVFRTLIIDPQGKRFKCSYSLCPGNIGGDLIELYAKAKKVDRQEAIKQILTHLPISVDWADQTGGPAPSAGEAPSRPEAPAPSPPRAQQDEAPAEPAAAPSRDAFSEACALLEEERWEEAEKILTEILRSNPKHLKALVGYARALEKLDRREALAALAPRVIDAALQAGEITVALAFFRRHAETASSVNEILGALETLIEPTQGASRGTSPLVEALMARAERCEAQGDYAAALALYRAAEPLAPPDLDLAGFVTQVLCQMGQTDEAVALGEARLARARQEGDLATAIESLRSMIDLDPSRVDLRQAFIETAIEDGLSPELFREVLRITDAWIEDSEFGVAREALELLAHYLPAEVAIQQRLWKIAEAQGDQRASRSTALRLANLCRQAGNPNESIIYLEKLPRDTSTPEHVELLAQCQFEAGEIEKAVEALVGLARHYDTAGAWASSEPLYSRLATWQPGEPRWRARQAKCKQQMGDTSGALSLYEQAGMDFLTSGRLDEAAEVWTEALAIDPAATDIAQAQHSLLVRLERQQEARRLSSSTVNYLKLNRGPRAAAEFLAGCIGGEEVSVDSTAALADLWSQADEPEEALSALRRGLSRARREGDQEAMVRLAQRWLAHEPENTEALEILATCGPASQSAGERRRMLAQLGESYVAHGDWARAVNAYSQLLELEPNDTRIQENLIACQEKRGDLDQAHRLRFHLAEQHFARQRWAECREVLIPLMAEAKPEPVIRHLLFQCHLHEEEIDEAVKVGRQLIDEAEAENDFDTAIGFVEQIVSRLPDSDQWLERLFTLQQAAGRTEDAVAAGRRLLQRAVGARDATSAHVLIDQLRTLAPRDRALRGELAEVLMTFEDAEEATREMIALASLHREAGDDAQAEELLRGILGHEPENAEARQSLLDLLVARGDAASATAHLWDRAMDLIQSERYDLAIGALSRLLEIDPEHIEARRHLAELLRAQLRNDEAVEQLAILAQMLADSGDIGSAIDTWQQVVALRPEVIPYHQALITCQLTAGGGAPMQKNVDALIQSLLSRGAAPDALACLDRFESFDAELPLWQRWRGEVLTQMGDAEGALAAFRRYSSLVDKHVSARVGRDLGPGAPSADPGEGFSLSPDHTFESFVVGDRNSFAFATAKAVAENPAKAYNPLFLYSDVGLGKTHLISAIGNHIRQSNPKTRVLYTSVEEFVSALVDAIQRNQVNEFRARHKHVDVLLIDDIQFLAGKERAQEEFFHLFNTLHQAKKQIVITSDRPPREMTHLEKRLRSRFGAGVIVDIQPPDFETRMAIVRQSAREATGGSLGDAVIDLVAERCTSNIRELKGALLQLMAISATRSSPLTRDEAAEVLDNILESVGG
jgi:tetratricopeptide (TPR) repeat protein